MSWEERLAITSSILQMSFFVVNLICFGGAMALCSYYVHKQIAIRQEIERIESQADNGLEMQNIASKEEVRRLLQESDRHKVLVKTSSIYFLIFMIPLMWCKILMKILENTKLAEAQ